MDKGCGVVASAVSSQQEGHGQVTCPGWTLPSLTWPNVSWDRLHRP